MAEFSGRKIAFHNLGCKVNSYETEAMLRQRENATRTKGDIHETDSAYLAACRSAARRAAEAVECYSEKGPDRAMNLYNPK